MSPTWTPGAAASCCNPKLVDFVPVEKSPGKKLWDLSGTKAQHSGKVHIKVRFADGDGAETTGVMRYQASDVDKAVASAPFADVSVDYPAPPATALPLRVRGYVLRIWRSLVREVSCFLRFLVVAPLAAP